MNKTETYIKKEILRKTTSPDGSCWSRDIMGKMVKDTVGLMDKGINVDDAIFKTLDTYY